MSILTYGLIISLVFFAIQEKDYTWSLRAKMPQLSTQKEVQVKYLFEQLNYMNFHPFCTSNILKSDIGDEKVFELVEETKLFGFLPIKLVSLGYLKKHDGTKYTLKVPLKILGLFEVQFSTEFHITKSNRTEQAQDIEIEERVKIIGPRIVTHVVGILAYPEHIEMLDRIKKEFSK